MLTPDDLKDFDPHELAFLIMYQQACTAWMVYEMTRSSKQPKKSVEDFLIRPKKTVDEKLKRMEEVMEQLKKVVADTPVEVTTEKG